MNVVKHDPQFLLLHGSKLLCLAPMIVDLIKLGAKENIVDAKYLVSHFVAEWMEIAISGDDLDTSPAVVKLNMLEKNHQNNEIGNPYLFHALKQIENDRRKRASFSGDAWTPALEIWNDKMKQRSQRGENSFSFQWKVVSTSPLWPGVSV